MRCNRVAVLCAHALLTMSIGCYVCGCRSVSPTGDYRIELPHGYFLVRMYSKTVGLGDASGEEVIAPHIDAYRVYSRAVVGHVSKHRDAYWQSVPGYFIVDTDTSKVYQGLSQREWLKQLRKYGIRSAPALARTRD